ncbi:MAG: alpha-mannosidase [Bacillota bacterium]
MRPVEAVIVSHTHWDREWYLPFQQFRARLVALVDYVMDLLEHDEAFKCFMLDGQAVVLEDYLEVRPENEERLRRLISERRLLVGPWYVLPDEFLSSEEALVRNLLIGRKVAGRFGPVMGVGYVPDPFGHIGQLPQILQGFGITSAVFSRGMGDEGESLGTEFRWRSPDGSEVLGIWLPAHYGSFTPVGSFDPWESDARFVARGHAGLPADEAVRFTRSLIEFLRARSRTGVLLLDTGSDHLAPRPDLPEIISGLQTALDEVDGRCGESCETGCNPNAGMAPRVRLVQGSLQDYVERVRERVEHSDFTGGRGFQLLTHEGEFRGSRYQNMLYSVLSSRIGIKQLNHEVDTWLTCYAEPLACAAWLLAGKGYPARMLDIAWRLYLQNQAHDSICGCSTDEVAAEMVARYTQAREIAVAVAAESLAALGRRANTAIGRDTALPVLVYNPTPWPMSGVARIRVPWDEVVRGRVDRGVSAACGASASDATCLSGSASHESGQDAARDASCLAARESMCFRVADGTGGAVDAQQLTSAGWGLGHDPSAVFHDKVRRGEPAVHLAFPVHEVPPLGYRVYYLASDRVGQRQDENGPTRAPGSVVAGQGMLENEFLRVQVSSCGTLDIFDKRTGFAYRGLNTFEDSGDAGDEYDYSPACDEPIVARNVAAGVVIEEPGPYVGRLRIEIPWEIPASLEPGRKRRCAESRPFTIVTHVTLAAGAPYVDIRTEVDNTARDHRLRALFPTGVRADRVCARGQFDVVRRAARARRTEAEWFQPEAATRPHQGFVDASDGVRGLAVATRGLPEYECLEEPDGTATIAITLLRCVEWLSRDDLTTRKGHAGPPVFTPGAQCPGKHVFEYAVVLHSGDWASADVHSIVRQFMCPCAAYPGSRHDGDFPDEMGLLRLGGRGAVVSAVKKAEDGDALVVRVHNPKDQSLSTRLEVGVPLERAYLARFDETPIAPAAFEPGDSRRLLLDLGPKQVVTLVLLTEGGR